MRFKRSYDPEIFQKAFNDPDDLNGISPEDWLNDRKNVMYLAEDGSVGLLSYYLPDVYNAHWFFSEGTRGRAAIVLGSRMLHRGFQHGMKVVQGITPYGNRAARWAVRQIGLTSYGIITYPDKGDCELFVMTKDEFYQRNSQWAS